MDVTCERCSTAYEFDDALVSERGTTVKCTNCGHQFKVRRPQPLGAPERWLVRTIDGRELEFRALRELQAAIAQAVITRDDVLSRGGSRPRRLGSIAELEPFFASVAGAGPAHSTSLGLGPRAPVITGYDGATTRPRTPTPQGLGIPPARTSEVSVAIPLPRGPDPDAETRIQPRRPPSVPPPPRRAPGLPGVIIGPGGAPPVPPAAVDEDAFFEEPTRAELRSVRAAPRADDVSAPTTPFHVGAVLDPVKVRALAQEDWSTPPAAAPAAEGPPPRPRGRPPAPPPPPPAAAEPPANDDLDFPAQNQHTASIPPLTPTPGVIRTDADDDLLEPRFSQAAAPSRSGAARWIVASIILGVGALAFATVGRKMLVPDGTSKAGGGEADARVGALLTEGEKSLVDGDLETAKEKFDKASVLGERDPRTAADLARFAAAKADVDWLRVRLLAPDDAELPIAKRTLEQAAHRAKLAADHAAELAAADIGVLRSRVDALRLVGDVADARRIVGPIAAAGTQPDNALTLAELELAESKPDWRTLLGRLRTAITSDGNLGRARSMLVYALACSGDVSGAKAELEQLAALPRPHLLVGALRAFVSRAPSAVDPNALPEASAKAATSSKPAAAAVAPAPVAHEPREPHELHEPRERPVPVEPRAPSPPPPEPVPEPIAPAAPAGPIDTSDLPGVKAPPSPAPAPPPPSPPTPSPSPARQPAPTAAPAPAPKLASPPGIDTSDLPGFK